MDGILNDLSLELEGRQARVKEMLANKMTLEIS
jgi:hypothetical protein